MADAAQMSLLTNDQNHTFGFVVFADWRRVVCETSRHLADELPPLEIAPDVQKIMESGTRKPFYSSADEGKDLDPDGLGILAEFPFLSGGKSSSPPSAPLTISGGGCGTEV
jgi:hypothetical protein